jgi:imidazolonepropionase-like amidohydrolase
VSALCFTHGRVIDGLNRPPVEDGFVRVEGETIAGVGRMADLPRSPHDDVRLVDVEGRTILPGLIDCHAHLVYSGFRSLDEIDRCPVETAVINGVLNAGKVLGAGFTTIRDLGTIGNAAVGLRDAIAAGKIRGPRVVASGRIIHTTAGHIDTLPSCLTNACGLGVRVDGPIDMLKAVRQQVRDGVDNIKLGATAAEGSPHSYTWMTAMNAEEMAVAIGEAHRFGRTVAVHCQSYESVNLALRAGADTIEHGTRMDDETIELFRESRAVLVPTLSTLFSVLELGEKLGVVPKQLEEMRVNRPLWLDSFRRAHAAGVPIAAGGDIGNRYPHGTNARELEHLAREGLTPLEAIHAATGLAARAIGRAAVLGSLEAGKLADILIVAGDPLDDIALLQDQARIWLVMQGGRAVAGSQLDGA